MRQPTGNCRPHRNAISCVPATVALLASWLLGTSQLWAIDFGDDVPKDKYPAVGMVMLGRYTDKGTEYAGHGTGTLIAPDIVLTVAHVVAHAPTPAHLFVKFESEEKLIRGLAYRTHPGYLSSLTAGLSDLERRWLKSTTNWDVRACDIALIKLERPVTGIPTYPLSAKFPAPETPLTVVGYGQTADKTSDLKRRSGDLKVVRIYNNMTLVAPANGKNQRADHGDSGGPLLIKQGDGFEISAAVHGVPSDERVNGLTNDEWVAMTAIPYIKPWADAMVAELGAISPAGGQYAYVRRMEVENPRLALSFRQFGALITVNPQNDVTNLNRMVARGVNDPLPLTLCETFRTKLGVSGEVFFPPLKPAK